MNTKSKAGRVAVAGVCGVLAIAVVACAGGGEAQAAATRRPAANGVHLGSPGVKDASSTGTYSQVTNLTPYPWTLSTTTYPIQGPYNQAPPNTLQPGQTATWSPHINHDSQDLVLTDYRFTDSTGKTHIMEVDDTGNGFDDPWYNSYSYDSEGAESPDYHMAFDPDGYKRHADAIWNSPTTIKIDAVQDPAAATNAVDNELPRANPNSEQWTPNPGTTPSFVWGAKTRATSLLTNYSSEPATLYAGHATSKGQSTSVGEEVSHSGSTNVEGVVFKDAESFTHDQSWGSSDSVATTQDGVVDPGNTGWIDKSPLNASMTGHLVFTTSAGTTFDLSNVTISKGDIINTGAGGVPFGIVFTPTECVIAKCPTADSPTGGTAAAKNSTATVRPATKATAISASPGQVVSIDGASDPADAIEALKNYQNATDRSFTPTTAATFAHSTWGPVYGTDGTTPAPAVSANENANHPSGQRLDITHQETSSWSLGGSIQGTVGFNLAGIIDQELSVKFTANHTWDSNTTDSQSIYAQAAPGKTVWIEASTGTASYTGNFAFTSGGVRYQVNNVTITQPASSDVDAMSNTSYRVMEISNVNAGVSPQAPSGLKTISKLPMLQQYINSGH
jgi:hypothetical protein